MTRKLDRHVYREDATMMALVARFGGFCAFQSLEGASHCSNAPISPTKTWYRSRYGFIDPVQRLVVSPWCFMDNGL